MVWILRDEQSDELVVVLSSGDKARLALAKSLLESADIKYYVVGEASQDLFVDGRLGFGYNPLTGPATIRVAAEDVDAALSVLSDLPEPRVRSLWWPIRVLALILAASALILLVYGLIRSLW